MVCFDVAFAALTCNFTGFRSWEIVGVEIGFIETRNEHIVPIEYYGEIKYFFLHEFDGMEHVLLYVGWIHTEVSDGAIMNKGHWVDGFTGVEGLQRLVGRIKVRSRDLSNKIYVVEEVCDSMIERLRDVLL